MNRITITIHVDLPEGMTPNVEYGDLPQEPPLVAAAMDIFPDAKPLPRPESMQRPSCQTHVKEMIRFPAGVSKKTQKPYGASWRCPVAGCETKPIWDAA